jgi:hypothetical protein
MIEDLNASVFPYFKYFHGVYNLLVILLFFYQAGLGLKIRKDRLAGKPPPVAALKRHRRFGPFLSVLAVAGFLAGAGIVYLDDGHVFEHQVHFLTGLVILSLVCTTFLISGKIRSNRAEWRNAHFVIGILILCFYLFQAYLGLEMLL